MILVDQVSKSFGSVQAVRSISFELAPGQVAGLLGPNGAGKTTTIRMIVGFLMPDRGRVLIDGKDTAASAAHARRQLGYMPEATPLYQEMRVGEYLTYRGKLFGLDRASRRAAATKVIDRCWLGPVITRRIGALSKGFKQRVGLAAALIHDPPVLVLDEPTNGLDPTQIREVRELVKELGKDRTMLISSHILPEVERLCDRLIVIAGGMVRADGSPADLTRGTGLSNEYIVQSRITRSEDVAKFVQLMSRLGFVASVEHSPHRGQHGEWMEWVIGAKPNAPDLREAIATAAMQGGVLLRELRTQSVSLERVFHQLIDDAGKAKASQATPPSPAPSPSAREAA